MVTPMFSARNVGVAIDRKPIIEYVNFDAAAGEFTAILGPNGSGKTTLLRALSGEIAYSGAITLNGADIATLRPWQAAALRAVLPQATAIAFPFTAREVVALELSAGRRGLPAGQQE